MANQNLLTFTSAAVGQNDLVVTRLDGVEGLSQLYRYEIELLSKRSSINLDAVLHRSASIGIKQGVQLHGSSGRGSRTIGIGGMVIEFEQREQRNEWTVYRAVFVPRAFKTTLNRVTQVFIKQSVSDIITTKLKDAGLTENTDFELRLSGDYPTREMIVQYEETDFAFISRWMEREGITFFFEQTENGEKMVFIDDSSGYPSVTGVTSLNYRPADATVGADADDDVVDDWFAEESVSTLAVRRNFIAKEAKLKDYNWRNPGDDLVSTADIDPDGYGTWYEYNEHFGTSGEGDVLARVRAEERHCRVLVSRGGSDCRSFSPGGTFVLNDHYRRDYNIEWALISVHHTATQTVSAEGATASATYNNTWVAIPAEKMYRPPRITPRPRIKGLIHGFIDSAAGGSYAELSDSGEYRVRLPWDIAGADKAAGAASRWIRMAQPYNGNGYGLHFPLHAGTEVLLAHIDGDPDRPIIVGAVPNHSHPAPVTSGNNVRNVIRSASGSLIEFDDTSGSEGITLFNSGGSGVMSFRAGGAPGGSGGTGGITPYWARTAEPAALDLEAAIGGSERFSSRVGIFAGPDTQFAPDGDGLRPTLLHRDDDGGGHGEDVKRQGDESGDGSDDDHTTGGDSGGGDSGDDDSHTGGDSDTGAGDSGDKGDGGDSGDGGGDSGDSGDSQDDSSGGDDQQNNDPPANEPTVIRIEGTPVEIQSPVDPNPGGSWGADDVESGGAGGGYDEYDYDAPDAAAGNTAEDIFFHDNGGAGAKSTFHTRLAAVGPGADFAGGTAGTDVSSSAGVFVGAATRYTAIEGNDVKVVNGVLGEYVHGDMNLYYGDPGLTHSYQIKHEFDSMDEQIICNDAGSSVRVNNADNGGDKVSTPGMSEFIAARKIHNITDTTTETPGTADSTILADGEIRESTTAKKIKETVTCTAGDGEIEGTTTATKITETTTVSGQIQETTTAGNVVETLAAGSIVSTAAFGNMQETETGTKNSYFGGAASDVFAGAFAEAFFGIKASLIIGVEGDLTAGAKVEVALGYFIDVTAGFKSELTAGHLVEAELAGKTEVNSFKSWVSTTAQMTVSPLKKLAAAISSIGTP